MKLRVTDIEEGTSGIVSFINGSVELTASKRSILLNKINLREGDEFELTLKPFKKTSKKK